MSAWWLRAFETVVIETPSSRAIRFIVGAISASNDDRSVAAVHAKRSPARAETAHEIALLVPFCRRLVDDAVHAHAAVAGVRLEVGVKGRGYPNVDRPVPRVD